MSPPLRFVASLLTAGLLALAAQAQLVAPPTVDWVSVPSTATVGQSVNVGVGAHANLSDNSDGNDWNATQAVIARVMVDLWRPGAGSPERIYEWLPTWQTPAEIWTSFTVTSPGTHYIHVQLMDGRPWYSGVYGYGLGVPTPAPTITSQLSLNVNQGFLTNYQITATNSPTSFSASGLPDSLSINSATGVISGRVTPGTSTVNSTISATNGVGTDTKTLTWNITGAVITPSSSASPSPVILGSSVTLTRGGTVNFPPISWIENVIWKPDGSAQVLSNSQAGSSSFTPATVGTYSYQIRVVDSSDYNYADRWINFTVTKASQAAVTITSGSATTYGNAYTATATGGSGTGALEWALGSGSTAAGAAVHANTGAVTANGAGTVVIKARRLGDANYNDSAWTADFPITVGTRPITVTLTGSKVYDAATAASGAAATVTTGSLAPGDSIAYAYGATSSPVAGTYTGLTTATVSNGAAPTSRTAAYAITYAGSYAITPRPITVTLAGSKIYDSTTAATGASAAITVGALAAGDSIGYAFAATSSPAAGSYPGLVTATLSNATAPTARSGSYAITYEGGYAITSRSITVTLAGSKVYDGATASTGATASITAGSLAGSDTIGYAFAAISSPVAGSYSDLTTATISNATAPVARAGSYTITYIGSYAVTPRPITVTLGGSKVYDGLTASSGASASVTAGSLAGSDTIGYVFGAMPGPVAGGYGGLATATIANAAAPTARSASYAITYDGSYAVTPRPITVTLTGSRVYDSTTSSSGASASITAGSLAGSDSIGYAFGTTSSPVADSYTNLATPTITSGTVPVARTDSYVITYAGSYAITPRPITVTLTGSKAYDGNTTPTGASASITAGALAGSDTIGYAFGVTSSAHAGTYPGLVTAAVSNITAPPSRSSSYAITHNGVYAIAQATQPALTLNAAASQNYGTAQTLTTTGGAGSGAVTYAIVAQSGAGVATLTGSSLTANTGTGWVDVQATKAAETNYLVATSSVVRVNFARIPQAILTVSAAPTSVVFGDTSALSVAGGSGTGAISYGAGAGGSITGSTFTATASSGSVLVTATKAADANYNATTATTTLNLGSRVITVTLAGSKVADGSTTATGASAALTVGNLAAGDTIVYVFANAGSPNADFYPGLTTATIKNAGNVDVTAHYAITYAGTYTIWPAPTVSSGLRAWYRADFGITKDGSGNVSQWADASGQGFTLTQTDPAKQPLWGATALNSQPALDFADGERLKSAVIDLLDAAGSNQDLTVLVVLQPSATQLSGASVLDHDSAQQGFSFKQDGATTNQYLLRWRNQVQTAWQGEGGPSVSTVVQPHLLTFIKAGTTQSAYVNGETAGSATVQANMHKPSASFAVGGSAANAADYFGGRIAEVLVYNRALTPTERSQVESGLGARYGLGSVGGEPDALPDAWELQYFGHLGYGPTENPDGDTLNNLREALLGRNPLKGAQPDSTGAVNLRVYSPRP